MCIYRKRLKKYFHRLWLKLLTLILVCVHYSIFGVLVFTFLFILDEHFVFVVHIINFTFRREREKKNMYVYTIRCIGSIRNNTASKEKQHHFPVRFQFTHRYRLFFTNVECIFFIICKNNALRTLFHSQTTEISWL